MLSARWHLVALCLLGLLAGVAGSVFVALPGLPLSYDAARSRWNNYRLDHYQIELQLDSPWQQSHLLLEVRKEKLVAGIDLRNGSPLTPGALAAQSLWLPIDRMFDRITNLGRHQYTWQERLGGLSPWLAQQLHLCIDPPTQIRYHSQLGYPAEVRLIRNTCALRGEIHVLLRVTELV